MTGEKKLLTAEEYGGLPDLGYSSELIQGRIVKRPYPFPRVGEIAAQLVYLLGKALKNNPQGHLACNCGIIAARKPDTVRHVDLAFWTYAEYPPGRLPPGFLKLPPRFVFDVYKGNPNWTAVFHKVIQLRNAGVRVFCLVMPDLETVELYVEGQPQQIFPKGSELILPEIFPELRMNVAEIFE